MPSLYRALVLCTSVALAAAPSGFTQPAPTDAAAALYLEQCAACHSVTGEPSESVDLLAATRQPVADLTASVRRMQDNVGPLTEEQIGALVGLLKSAELRERLALAENPPAPVASVAPASPASAERGRRLFFGEEALEMRGAACAACHAADGRGGTLARDLTVTHTRLGQAALVSAVQRPAFPLMKPLYAKKAVTAAEAADIAAYLERVAGTATPGPRRRVTAPPLLLGAAGGMVVLAVAGTAFISRARRAGIRSRLVRKFTRRS